MRLIRNQKTPTILCFYDFNNLGNLKTCSSYSDLDYEDSKKGTNQKSTVDALHNLKDREAVF